MTSNRLMYSQHPLDNVSMFHSLTNILFVFVCTCISLIGANNEILINIIQ